MAAEASRQLGDQLRERLGFQAAPEWLARCVAHLQAALPGFAAMPLQPQQLRYVLDQLLVADFHACGAGGCLPDVQGMHDQVLQGTFLLQLDEVVNVAANSRDRYNEQGPGRCLKLRLTDGHHTVMALEYRHLPALRVLMPAGAKVAVKAPYVRRGMLLLQPGNLEVLGGQVDHLEAARQRLLEHWAKPADHCAAAPSADGMYQAAAAAAWPAAAPAATAGPAPQQPAAPPAAAPGAAPRQLGIQPGPGLAAPQPAAAAAAAAPPGGLARQGPGSLPAPPPQQQQQQQPPPRRPSLSLVRSQASSGAAPLAGGAAAAAGVGDVHAAAATSKQLPAAGSGAAHCGSTLSATSPQERGGRRSPPRARPPTPAALIQDCMAWLEEQEEQEAGEEWHNAGGSSLLDSPNMLLVGAGSPVGSSLEGSMEAPRGAALPPATPAGALRAQQAGAQPLAPCAPAARTMLHPAGPSQPLPSQQHQTQQQQTQRQRRSLSVSRIYKQAAAGSQPQGVQHASPPDSAAALAGPTSAHSAPQALPLQVLATEAGHGPAVPAGPSRGAVVDCVDLTGEGEGEGVAPPPAAPHPAPRRPAAAADQQLLQPPALKRQRQQPGMGAGRGSSDDEDAGVAGAAFGAGRGGSSGRGGKGRRARKLVDDSDAD